jgi:hypothetical protein
MAPSPAVLAGQLDRDALSCDILSPTHFLQSKAQMSRGESAAIYLQAAKQRATPDYRMNPCAAAFAGRQHCASFTDSTQGE